PRPQTTRRRIRGILTRPDAQVVFVDTPGIHDPYDKLGEFMVEWAMEAIPGSDLVVFLVDVSRPPNDKDREIAEKLMELGIPTLLVLNKADLVAPETLPEREEAYQALGRWVDSIVVSLTEGRAVDRLMDAVISNLPEGPRFYPPDQLSDQYERDIVAELIREQALLQLEHEVPHALDVQVEEFKERENGVIYVSA